MVNKYMMEYINTPEAQQKIKTATIIEVERLLDGVIKVIISSSQNAIKSEYANFVKETKIHEIK